MTFLLQTNCANINRKGIHVKIVQMKNNMENNIENEDIYVSFDLAEGP